MKKLTVFILLFMPLLIFGQGTDLAGGTLRDVIAAVVGMILYAAKDFLVSLFQLWTAKIRAKIPTKETK